LVNRPGSPLLRFLPRCFKVHRARGKTYHFCEIIERETGPDRVYTHGLLADTRGAGQRQDLADVRAGGGFRGDGYGVFQVVGLSIWDSRGGLFSFQVLFFPSFFFLFFFFNWTYGGEI
jgi:hypothetical protein